MEDRRERRLFWSVAAVTAALRALAFFRYRFDSDEQQHLHVVWGWTAGGIQYRDFFDNHAPLFHMMSAPLLAVLGERPDILLLMRVPMLAVFALAIWATYDLGRRLYDARVGAWAALLTALFPPFFLKSLEFRPDNVWAALVVLVLLGLARRWPPFVTGLILGVALTVSTKTSVVVIALSGAALVTEVLVNRRRRFAVVVPAALGFAIVPAVVVAYFFSAGAWDELVFCNFTFNGRLAGLRPELWVRRAAFPFALAAVLWGAWRHRATAHVWRYFLALFIGFFFLLVAGVWPVIGPRDLLPLMPLCAIFAAAFIVRTRRPLHSFAAIAALSVAALWYYADRFENRTDEHITMMNQVLRVTRPGERLIDYKGETIYRQRPFYFALELNTRTQIARGIIPDTIAEDVVRTRTYAAQADGPMWPPHAREFLSANFVNLGRIRAAGQFVREDGSFTIAIPGEYVVVNERGEARGSLDGSEYRGARTLGAGAHRWSGDAGVAVVWAPAFQRGHSPFHLRDTDF